MTLSLKDSKKNSNLKNKLGIIFAIKKILFFNKGEIFCLILPINIFRNVIMKITKVY